MNTTPSELSTEAPAVDDQRALPGWQQRNLSPRRGAIALVLGLIVLSQGHFFWELFSHLVIILLEVAEEFLDVVLEAIGLGSGTAQMVTAYIGLSLFLLLLVYLAKRAVTWPRRVSALIGDYWEMYVHVFKNFLRAARAEFKAWWATLDWLGKTAAVTAGIVFVIPLLVAVSIGLGIVVSSLVM